MLKKIQVQLLVKTHISFFMISLKYIIKMFRIPSYQNKLVIKEKKIIKNLIKQKEKDLLLLELDKVGIGEKF